MICYVFFVSKSHSVTLFSMYSAMRFSPCGVAARHDPTGGKHNFFFYHGLLQLHEFFKKNEKYF